MTSLVATSLVSADHSLSNTFVCKLSLKGYICYRRGGHPKPKFGPNPTQVKRCMFMLTPSPNIPLANSSLIEAGRSGDLFL